MIKVNFKPNIYLCFKNYPNKQTNNITLLMLLRLVLSRNFWIFKFFEELIQIICLSSFPPFPKVFRYKWCKTACKELLKKKNDLI